MALLLEAITDVPCSLASTSDEGRNRAIDQWLAELSKKEHPSEGPESSGNP
jgi:predicted membrane-bound mannosyltransferase